MAKIWSHFDFILKSDHFSHISENHLTIHEFDKVKFMYSKVVLDLKIEDLQIESIQKGHSVCSDRVACRRLSHM